MHSFSSVFYNLFKQREIKEPCLTVLRLKATAETRKVLSNKMAKLPWVHGRGLDTFYPRRACNSSRGRQMVNAWTKEALEHRYRSQHVAQLAL